MINDIDYPLSWLFAAVVETFSGLKWVALPRSDDTGCPAVRKKPIHTHTVNVQCRALLRVAMICCC